MNTRYNNPFTLRLLSLILLLSFAIPRIAAGQRQSRPSLPPEIVAALPGPAPSNLTLTPVTPTNIRVEWSPSPGAVRYIISRNGAPDIAVDANAGFLQGNRFLYTDVGRRPAMLHTYSVTALFPAPVRPGRSAPAQVVTPSAAAPQNFRAAVSANAVTLSWTARPEATGYRIVRNGGNQPPAVLIASGLTYVDKNRPAGQYTYTLSSIVRLATGEELSGDYTSPVTVMTRSFNMIAMGDSVMWGQGLRCENKFATKVQQWIQGELGKTVILNLKAHSGAITYPNDPKKPRHEDRYYDGEVPSDWPTISYQISVPNVPNPAANNGCGSVPNPAAKEDVDLVLINGCANNLGIFTVLNPIGTDDSLRTKTGAYCGEGMTNLLRDVVQEFPNAQVILTGYFPFVSKESDFRALLPIFSLAGALIPPDPLTVGYLS